MFRNYLITTLRNLVKDKYYSAINILGLAVGLTITILIILYIYDELTYDKHHLLHERVYRLESDFTLDNKNHKFAVTQIPLGPTLKDDYPEIEEFTRVQGIGTTYFKHENYEFQEDSIMFADSTFFRIFTHEFLFGDPDNALTRPNTIVLTSSLAQKYFGNENPLGKTIQTIEGNIFEVTAVIENLPGNSHLKFNGLISAATIAERIGADRFNDRSAGSFWNINIYTYVLVSENSDINSVLEKMPEFYDKYMREIGDQIKGGFNLMVSPLADLHLNAKNLENDLPKGNMSYIYIFLFAALFILIIASINYMNMATARSMRRAREVGMRKISGASRGLLIRQFLGESVFVAFFSFIIAAILVLLLLPVFNDLSGKILRFGFISSPDILFAGFLIALLVGFLSGVYPAFYLSRFNPVQVLKGTVEKIGGRGLSRKILVLIQFLISVFMIIGTMVISGQLKFMRNTDLGFNKDNMIIMTVRDTTLRKSMESFKAELLQHSEITAAAMSTSDPGRGMGIQVMRMEGEGGELVEKALNNYFIDYDYVDMLGIEMKLGRNYDREMGTDINKAFIINETAAKELGWGDDALGKRFQYGIDLEGPPRRDGEIIGVFKDYHYQSLHNKIEPLLLLIQDNTRFMQLLNIRTTGNNTEDVLAFIDEKRKEFGDQYPFNYSFLEEDLDEFYKAESIIGKIFRYFTILTIFIASLGLLGLSAFMAQQRTREIGIRKVVGSSITGVVMLFVKDFSIWIGLANLLAWPLAWFAMTKWLQDFQYRVDITVWLFAIALALSWIIAILTISWQSIRAATINPAESLKYE